MPLNNPPTDANLQTSDITTNDATTSKHGFLQKLPGGTTSFLRADGTFATPAGAGDVSSNTAVSVDSEVVLFNSTTGKSIKRATASGIPNLNAGVLSTVVPYNLLMNGAMEIWQRATTFTTPNDDTYIADRWNCLQEANGAWTFSQSTDVPANQGFLYSLKAVNVTLNNQCGIVQFLEQKDLAKLAGQNVSLSLFAKTTTGKVIANLRVALLSWTGTADTLTSDVVSAWAQNGTDPTWAANYTVENTPGNLALVADTWTQYAVENVAIDTSSVKNLAVVVWVDDGTIVATDEFYITGVQLTIGSKVTSFQHRSFATELESCKRFYQTSVPYGIIPGVTGTAEGYQGHGCIVIADTATDAHGANPFRPVMRSLPTVKLYAFDGAAGAGTVDRVRDETAGGLETVTAFGPATNMATGVAGVTVNTTFVVGRAYGFNYTADAEM